MAQNISTHNNVVDIKRGRGRPKLTPEQKAEKAAGRAQHQAATVGRSTGPEQRSLQELLDARKVAKTPEDATALDVEIAEIRAEANAPSFGHNQLDAGGFLQWVQKLNKHDEAGDEIKAKLKVWRTDRKLLRKEAGGAGIGLRQLDEALEDLKTEHVDLIEREQRRRSYHEWLGIPLETVGELIPTFSIDPEREAKRFFKQGDMAGRLGKPRTPPVTTPPEHVQDWLRGHEAGQELLMRASPLTAGAFDDAGKLKTEADPKPAAAAFGEGNKFLTLGAENFQTGTELLDCNLSTLLPGFHEAFHNAEEVVVVYGDKKRCIKEEGYVDDGSTETEVTEPEPIQPGEFA